MSNALTDLLGTINTTQPTFSDDGFRLRSDLVDTDFVPAIPPAEIDLRGYQRAAVETILEFRKGILGFAPGMGKTAVAVTAMANIEGRTVVVIPPSLMLVWKMELARLYPDLKVVVTTGRKEQEIPDGDVLLIGDSVIFWRFKNVLMWEPSMLVIDEAHRHKNSKSKRAQGVSKLADYIRGQSGYVVLLTGTLALNNAVEVWMPAQIAGVAGRINGGSPSYEKWISKWCYLDQMPVEKKIGKGQTKKIWINIPRGAKDPDGLHEALRQHVYVRVEREDVLDMPDKMRIYRSVEGTTDGMKEYSLIKNNFETWLKEQGGEEALERVKGSEKLVQLGKLREAAGTAKLESSAEYIANLVEQGEQVVVMAHNKSVVVGLRQALTDCKIKSVTFYGDDSPEAKERAVERFKSGEIPVFIGNIASAGTGLNLENSAHLVFVQLPWSPGDFVQASDRIYRVTQERDCTIHILVTAGTVDEHVAKVLEEKALLVDAINAGESVEGDFDENSIASEIFEQMIGE